MQIELAAFRPTKKYGRQAKDQRDEDDQRQHMERSEPSREVVDQQWGSRAVGVWVRRRRRR